MGLLNMKHAVSWISKGALVTIIQPGVDFSQMVNLSTWEIYCTPTPPQHLVQQDILLEKYITCGIGTAVHL